MGLCSVISMVLASAIAAGSGAPVGPDPRPVSAASADRPMPATLQELTPLLMALPGVVGVGEGRCDDKPCIKVFVTAKTADLVRRIHEVARGTPTDIVETGEIRARTKHD